MKPHERRARTRNETIAYLTEACKIFTQGLNKRDFDASSPHWQVVADNFEADFDHPVLGRVRHDLPGTLEVLRELASKFPAHESRVSNVDVRLNGEKGQAEVFAVVDSYGSPPEQVRQSLVTQQWQRIDGRWLCTRYTGVRGMADGAIAEWWGTS